MFNQNSFNKPTAFQPSNTSSAFGSFVVQTPQFGSTNAFGQTQQQPQNSLFNTMSSSQPQQTSLFSNTTSSTPTQSFGFNQPISQQQGNIGTSNVDYRIKVDGKNNLKAINCKLDLKDKTLTELQYEDRFKKPCGPSQPAALPAPSSSSSPFGSSLFSSAPSTQQSTSSGFGGGFGSSLFNKPNTISSPLSSPMSSPGGFGSTGSLFNKPAATQSTGLFGSSSTTGFGSTPSNMNTAPSFGMSGSNTSGTSSMFNKGTTMGGMNTSSNLNRSTGMFGAGNTGLNTSLNTTVSPGTSGTGFGFGSGSGMSSNTNTMGNMGAMGGGGTPNLFNKPTGTSIFNTTPSTTNTTTSGLNTGNSLFGTSQPSMNIGLNTNTTTGSNSLFSTNTPASTSLFNSPTTSNLNTTNSLFGATQKTTPTNTLFNTNNSNLGGMGTTSLFGTPSQTQMGTNNTMNNMNAMGSQNSLSQQQLIDLTNPYLVNLELSKQVTPQSEDYIKRISASLIKAYESSNLSLEFYNDKYSLNNNKSAKNKLDKNVKIINTGKSRNGFTMVKEHIENSRKFLKKITHESTIKTFKVPTKKLETFPKIDDVQDKNNVDGFKVKNVEFGEIKWIRRIDIEAVKFDSIFTFKSGSLEVNPNRAFGLHKINTKAQITFYNIWPKNEYGEREKTDSIIKLSKYENALRKYIGQISGSEFIKYNYKNGEMSFIVRNFDYFISK